MKRLDIINSLTIYGHIITAKQRTIIQQYGDWYTMAVDGWAVTFVQRGGTWSDCGPAHSPPRCIKCNSPPINGQCTNFISFDVALLLLNSEGLIHLLCSSACYLTTHCIQIGRPISCGYSVCLSVCYTRGQRQNEYKFVIIPFLSRPVMLVRDIATGDMSVCVTRWYMRQN